ncbi:MAG: nucleoside kinase [Lachnospiraceae bacterium]|nr:nucleoside kinase [Lachnospiraceae bacterium]
MAKLMINGKEYEYDEGTKFEYVAKDFQKEYADTIALVIENGKMRELTKSVKKDATIEFLTLGDKTGHKTYVRTATMILIKSMYDVLRDRLDHVSVEYAIGQGYYLEVELKEEKKLSDADVAAVKERMQELIDADRPITKRSYPKDDAIRIFRENGMMDKVRLFEYRRSSSINVYCLDDYYDYYYGYMLPSTGYVKYYDVIPYEDGVMLLIPHTEDPSRLGFFEPREKLFATMKRSNDWGKLMGICNVGELNDCICSGNIDDMILVAEALQERRIGEIAKEIVDRGDVKFVLIAGPSSSGKTSFSHRLSIQLRTFGKVPHPIAMDDYFVDREFTPLDENGNYDFECIEAIDTDKFNEDLTNLLEGKEVELPDFNFKVGKREYNGKKLKLSPDDILVIEGIHGLNPAATNRLPEDSKFKIFISALTTLNIDDHNRIPTTDARMLRRIVRDARTRGASAKRTIGMWQSVRRGEEKNIFPYQESADVMFNSALIYELAALKQYAEPLLFSIRQGEPEYFEAKRMLKFLEYFVGIDVKHVPNNSLCREFVGGSYFKV